MSRPLASVTGASTGIGYHLARTCARNGFDLIVAADENRIVAAAEDFSALGAQVTPVVADLSTRQGVDTLLEAAGGRPIDALLANAGMGLSDGFLDQSFDDVEHLIGTNVTGTIYLIYKVGQQMRRAGKGRILVTGSIAGFMPGPFNAVYNATKAFIDSFSWALHNELKDSGVSVTCLMPGATETAFFERAGLLDTKLGQSKKDDPGEVAEIGFRAMMNGDGDVVSGWHNKLQSAIANITPASVLAELHRKEAQPGTGKAVGGAQS